MHIVNTAISLVASLSYSLLFVFSLRERRRVNRIFSAYLLGMGLWTFTSALWHADLPVIGELPWLQAGMFAAISSWMLMCLLSVTILDLDSVPVIRAALWVIYGLGGLLLIGNLGGQLVHVTRIERGLFDVQFGDLIYLFFALAGLSGVAFVILFTRAGVKTRDHHQRNRLFYLATGNTLIVMGGLANLSPQLRPFPVDVLTGMIAAVLMAYAIYRYQLLDVSLVVRKGLLYLIPTAIISILDFVIIVFTVEALHALVGYQLLFLSFLIAVTTVIVVQPLRDMAQAWVDRLFFREKYDSGMMLQRLSRTAASVLDLDRLTNMILDEITATIHIERTAFFVRQEESGEFRLMAQRGLDDRTGLQLRRDHPIVVWLSTHGRALTRRDIETAPQFKALQGEEKKDLDRMAGELFVSLVANGKMVGILAVGPKLSEVAYSQDDQLTLTTLANQAAVAIENARLYDAAQRELAERKRAEGERARLLAQIRAQARQVQHIVDTVPEGVLLLNDIGKVILANPVADGSLSVLASAQVGDTLTHLGDRPLAELLAPPPKGLRHEVAADGRDFEIIARPVESALGAGDWVLVIREVTEEREVQRRAQRRDRLASVGQMAAGIAHDFNNMLTTIMLYAQILRRHRYLPSDMEPGLETILNETRRATDLVGQILDFSRSAPIETHPVDLRPWIKENVAIFEHTLRDDIRLRLDLKAEKCMVAADPTRLQQVMMNLVINARDAMPGGGELSFVLDRVEVKAGEDPPVGEMAAGEWVCMAVSDTGTGIAPEVLAHIFEPFYTTKAPGKGTGLGLAQVYGIVRQHGGHVGVDTELGQGTMFLVYLPARDGQTEKDEREEAASMAAGEGETILLVDDEERLRDSTREVLESLGYRVLVAGNGEEALKVYSEAGGVDLVMPNLGGEELIQQLREADSTLRALAVTGYVAQEDLSRLAEAGFMDVVRKPFDVDALATAVRSALGCKD